MVIRKVYFGVEKQLTESTKIKATVFGTTDETVGAELSGQFEKIKGKLTGELSVPNLYDHITTAIDNIAATMVNAANNNGCDDKGNCI